MCAFNAANPSAGAATLMRSCRLAFRQHCHRHFRRHQRSSRCAFEFRRRGSAARSAPLASQARQCSCTLHRLALPHVCTPAATPPSTPVQHALCTSTSARLRFTRTAALAPTQLTLSLRHRDSQHPSRCIGFGIGLRCPTRSRIRVVCPCFTHFRSSQYCMLAYVLFVQVFRTCSFSTSMRSTVRPLSRRHLGALAQLAPPPRTASITHQEHTITAPSANSNQRRIFPHRLSPPCSSIAPQLLAAAATASALRGPAPHRIATHRVVSPR